VPEKRLSSLFDLPRPSPAIKKDATASTGVMSPATKDLGLFAEAEIAVGEELPTPSTGYAVAKDAPPQGEQMPSSSISKAPQQIAPKDKAFTAETPKAPKAFAEAGAVAKNVAQEYPSVDVPQKGKLPNVPEPLKGEAKASANVSKETATVTVATTTTVTTPMSQLKALLAAAKEEKGASLPFDAVADSSRASQAGKLASRQEEAVATVNEPMAKGAKEVGLEKKPSLLKKDEESLSIYNAPTKNDKEGMSKGDNPHSSLAKEQMDPSTVNQAALGRPSLEVQPIAAAAAPTPPPPVVRANIRELVNQITKTIEVLEMSGKTETVVVLKNPPIFEGARVVITGFDSARKDVHIAFENLTNAAQHLVDLQANRAQLLNSLEREGYNVRIFTSTTSDVPRLVTGSDLPDRQQRDPRDQEHSEQQKRQQQRQRNQA